MDSFSWSASLTATLGDSGGYQSPALDFDSDRTGLDTKLTFTITLDGYDMYVVFAKE